VQGGSTVVEDVDEDVSVFVVRVVGIGPGCVSVVAEVKVSVVDVVVDVGRQSSQQLCSNADFTLAPIIASKNAPPGELSQTQCGG